MTIEQDIENHDNREGGVYLVEVFHREKFIRHAVFSKFEKAKLWIHDLPKEYTSMCAPFVLDQPEYGVLDKEEMN